MSSDGCQSTRPTPEASAPRDINAVLADHAARLMESPGVVGVCVALLPDGRTPCLKVMLARPDPALERALPRELEGHPVRTEVTGEFRPLR